ncbi:MAG: DUF4397 domain-containing protein [Burkholderiaceae bacterium]
MTAFAAITVGVIVAGCSVSQDTALVRVVELIDSLSPTDAYFDDIKTITGGGYETVSTYAAPEAGERTMALKSADGTSNLLTSTVDLGVDGQYSAVLAGTTASPALYLVDELPAAPGAGEFRVQVLNTITSGPAYDVYITPDSASLASVSPTVLSTAGGQTSAAFSFSAGTYRLRLTSGTPADLVFDSGPLANIVFTSGGTGTLVIYKGASATLVKAILLTGSAADSAQASANSLARIRLVNASTSVQTLNLRQGGNLLFGGMPSSGGSIYKEVAAATNTYSLDNNAVPSADFGDFPLTLTAGEDHTILAVGDEPNVGLTLITDNNNLPRSSFAGLRIINGVSGAGDATVLVGYTVGFSAVPQGQASDQYLDYVPATYNFGAQYTNGAQTFDLGNFELETDRVYSLLMHGPVSAPQSVLLTDR